MKKKTTNTYREVEGDLLAMFHNGDFTVIAHGCNCKKSMTGGIALQIARKYPKAEKADNYSTMSDIKRYGDVTCAPIGMGQKIYNLYSQFLPGKDLSYPALELSLTKLALILKANDPNASIGLPQIGCGIAGGDWKKIRPIIKRALKGLNVTIVIYNPNV